MNVLRMFISFYIAVLRILDIRISFTRATSRRSGGERREWVLNAWGQNHGGFLIQ